MQGNCSGTTPTTEALLHAAAELQPPLPPLAPGQCLILTDANAIAAWHTLWLDSLLLRHVPSRRSPGAAWLLGGDAPPAATTPGLAAALYLTRTTLQGSVAVPADQEGGAGGRRDTGAAGQARPSLSQELHRDGSSSFGVVVRDSLFAGGARCSERYTYGALVAFYLHADCGRSADARALESNPIHALFRHLRLYIQLDTT